MEGSFEVKIFRGLSLDDKRDFQILECPNRQISSSIATKHDTSKCFRREAAESVKAASSTEHTTLGGGDYTAWCQSLGKATEAAPAVPLAAARRSTLRGSLLAQARKGRA